MDPHCLFGTFGTYGSFFEVFFPATLTAGLSRSPRRRCTCRRTKQKPVLEPLHLTPRATRTVTARPPRAHLHACGAVERSAVLANCLQRTVCSVRRTQFLRTKLAETQQDDCDNGRGAPRCLRHRSHKHDAVQMSARRSVDAPWLCASRTAAFKSNVRAFKTASRSAAGAHGTSSQSVPRL